MLCEENSYRPIIKLIRLTDEKEYLRLMMEQVCNFERDINHFEGEKKDKRMIVMILSRQNR